MGQQRHANDASAEADYATEVTPLPQKGDASSITIADDASANQVRGA